MKVFSTWRSLTRTLRWWNFSWTAEPIFTNVASATSCARKTKKRRDRTRWTTNGLICSRKRITKGKKFINSRIYPLPSSSRVCFIINSVFKTNAPSSPRFVINHLRRCFYKNFELNLVRVYFLVFSSRKQIFAESIGISAAENKIDEFHVPNRGFPIFPYTGAIIPRGIANFLCCFSIHSRFCTMHGNRVTGKKNTLYWNVEWFYFRNKNVAASWLYYL